MIPRTDASPYLQITSLELGYPGNDGLLVIEPLIADAPAFPLRAVVALSKGCNLLR